MPRSHVRRKGGGLYIFDGVGQGKTMLMELFEHHGAEEQSAPYLGGDL